MFEFVSIVNKLSHGTKQLWTRAHARGFSEVAELTKSRIKEEIRSGDTLLFLVKTAEPTSWSADGLRFRQAEAEDGERYARDIGTDSASTFRDRLTAETRCFLVEDDDRILHSSWVSTGPSWAREIRAHLVPPPGDAYVYESFTRADARGRGIYPFALANIVTRLSAEGTRRVWIAVEEDNAPSRRAIDKVGFEFAFAITYKRRLGRFAMDEPRGPQAEIGKEFVRRRR
jgi:RimJ/RimL family protein N-acetyltransferase